MSNLIMRFYIPKNTDLPQVPLDLTRSTLVITHQSITAQQEPSLFLQEQLVAFAMKLRGENDNTHIRLYQEGRQEQITDLPTAISSGDVGSIIVERPDRLLRSEHAPITDLLQKQRITVIVPGKRSYDLSKEEDVKAFQAIMRGVHDYIASYVTYMKDTRHQKRGKRERHTPAS